MNQLATTGFKRVDSKGHRNFNTAFAVYERTKDLIVWGVTHALKQWAAEAGIEGFISGHSRRAGSAVSLAQAGATVVNM